MSMFALVVRFELHDEAAAVEFDALTQALVAQIAANERGTLLYATHTVEDAPLSRVFYEAYADEAAFQAHQDAAYVQAFLAARAPLLADRRVERLTPTLTAGLAG